MFFEVLIVGLFVDVLLFFLGFVSDGLSFFDFVDVCSSLSFHDLDCFDEVVYVFEVVEEVDF